VIVVEISAAEYAERHGISVRRVQAAAANGALGARRLAGRWVIDDAGEHHSTPGRPLSARTVAALRRRLSGDAGWHEGLSNSERARVRSRVESLLESRTAAAVLAAWTRTAYAPPEPYRAADGDLDDLRHDGRLTLGGISDPRARISDAGVVEAHVADADLAGLQREYLLVASRDRPNVLLHIDQERPARPLPLGALIIELAHHDGPRERAAASELLRHVQ
jgi:hypothetical protein